MKLDRIGIRAGTDKSCLVHDYLRHYEPLFDRAPDELVLMEIGVHMGASLSMWKTFLPHATIVGVDIAPDAKRFERDGVVIEIGSQYDGDFLREIGKRHRPYIVIDDGSHIEDHQIYSFEHLFEYVSPGGLYIIEDVPNFTPELKSVAYFSDLQKELFLRNGRSDIGSIQTIRGSVIIRKNEKNKTLEDLDAVESLIANGEIPECKLYYLNYLMRAGSDDARLLAAAEDAVAAEPRNPWTHFSLSKVHSLSGRLDEAVAALDMAEAVALTPIPLFIEYRKTLSSPA